MVCPHSTSYWLWPWYSLLNEGGGKIKHVWNSTLYSFSSNVTTSKWRELLIGFLLVFWSRKTRPRKNPQISFNGCLGVSCHTLKSQLCVTHEMENITAVSYLQGGCGAGAGLCVTARDLKQIYSCHPKCPLHSISLPVTVPFMLM